MATYIFIRQNGTYFASEIDLTQEIVNGERMQEAYINRIDYIEPVGIINKIKHKLFPIKELHIIIARGNKIHGIEAKW